jgi:hypothetical protein
MTTKQSDMTLRKINVSDVNAKANKRKRLIIALHRTLEKTSKLAVRKKTKKKKKKKKKGKVECCI